MPVNANSYGPYDSGAGANITENFWRLMARWFAPSAVVGSYLNELNPFGDSTGLQAKVNTGAAVVRGAYGEWTASSTLGLAAVGAIAGGSERWDRIVCRNDFVNNVMQLDVLTGSVGASPNSARPALTQNSSMYEMLLADVGPLVNTTTTVTAAMVIDGRWKITESGVLYFEAAPTGTSLTIPGAGVIPAAAKTLAIEWQVLTTSGNATDDLLVRANGVSTTTYSWTRSVLGGTYASSGQTISQTSYDAAFVPGTGGNPAVGTTKIWFPANSAGLKLFETASVRADGVNGTFPQFNGGAWSSGGAAITTLTLLLSAGSYSGSSFVAYAYP